MKRKRKAGAPAKRVLEASASDDEDESSDAEEDAKEVAKGGTLDVEFDLCDPDEEDYHPVQNMLKTGTWDFMELNFSELTDSLVGQGNIGALVKADNDDGCAEEDIVRPIFGLLTALNLRQFADKSWPKAIGQALAAKANKHASPEALSSLQALLEQRKNGKEVGLILTERFHNLPLELVPALHTALKEDIEWSCTTPDCPAEERPFYRFTDFLGVTKCFGSAGAASSASTGQALSVKKKKRKQAAGPDGEEGLTYAHTEFDIYVKHATFSFSFPMPQKKEGEGERMPKQKGGGGPGPERRMVFWLTAKAFGKAVAEIKQEFKD